jgi:predicted metal-dependent peptidase
MNYTEQTLRDDIRKVTRLVQQVSPFFYVLPFKVISDEEWKEACWMQPDHPTAFANAKGFFFAGSFMDKLPENQRLGLLLHEVFHPALGHLSNPWIDRRTR